VDEVAQGNRITIALAEGDVTPVLQATRQSVERASDDLEQTRLF
jgi:hypothetical protein